MILSVGVGLVALLTTVYIGKKGWQALHHIAGITPGKVTYIEQSNSTTTQDSQSSYLSVVLCQLQLDTQYLEYLPLENIEQLQRIDSKVQAHENWKQQDYLLVSHVVTEETFLLQKLITERLPEVLSRYHYLAKNQALTIGSSPIVEQPPNLVEAQQVLQVLLERIESNLNKVLSQYEQEQLQSLRAMRRYLDSRDD